MSEPAGIVIPFAGSTPPQGYLLCDGSAVSRDTYSALFAVIGTVYGAGDGSTTFNVPDLSGRVVLGVSQSHALGSTGGSETVTLTENQLPAHSHVVPQHGHGNDIAAAMPALSHTVTQAVFKYNSPGSSTALSGSDATLYTGTNTASASRKTNFSVSDHVPQDCTTSGSVTACPAMTSGSSGQSGVHSNMQPYMSLSYIISTGE